MGTLALVLENTYWRHERIHLRSQEFPRPLPQEDVFEPQFIQLP